MKKIALYSSACLILAACGSMIDHQTVEMTVKTPGAENAKCYLENEDHKFVVYSNETVQVMKSPHDLVVRCLAPGNREKTVLVKRELNNWVFVNVVNGFVPGTAYDVLSRGVYDYPDEVTVSFVGEAVKQYPLPDYMAADLVNGNHKGKTEYMGPGTVIAEKDKHHQPQVLEKKDSLYSDFFGFDNYEPSAPATPQASPYSPPAVSYNPTEEDK